MSAEGRDEDVRIGNVSKDSNEGVTEWFERLVRGFEVRRSSSKFDDDFEVRN